MAEEGEGDSSKKIEHSEFTPPPEDLGADAKPAAKPVFLRNKWTKITAVGSGGLILMIWLAWAFLSP